MAIKIKQTFNNLFSYLSVLFSSQNTEAHIWVKLKNIIIFVVKLQNYINVRTAFILKGTMHAACVCVSMCIVLIVVLLICGCIYLYIHF